MPIRDNIVGLADKKKIVDSKTDSILKDYVEVPQILIGASQWAVDAWIRLGRPSSPFTDSGERLMKVLISMWEELYPNDSKQWYADRAEYQKEELSVSTQISKHTGGSLASFPYPLFRLMKRFFPDIKFSGIGGREVCKKMVRRFPMFRMSKFRS
jgi:hypothetical protein